MKLIILAAAGIQGTDRINIDAVLTSENVSGENVIDLDNDTAEEMETVCHKTPLSKS